MARDLRRRLARLEHRGRPPAALLQQWRQWLGMWEAVYARAQPDSMPRSDAKLWEASVAEAKTRKRPAQPFTEALIGIWRERQSMP